MQTATGEAQKKNGAESIKTRFVQDGEALSKYGFNVYAVRMFNVFKERKEIKPQKYPVICKCRKLRQENKTLKCSFCF